MIARIEAKNFRSLRYVNQPLEGFHVLVGPNASGKTTFLDVVKFLADAVSNGIDFAIAERTANFEDLTFANQGGDVELALEVRLPEEIREHFEAKKFRRIRYEMRFGLDSASREHAIFEERAILLEDFAEKDRSNGEVPNLFPVHHQAPSTILHKKYNPATYKQVINKNANGSDNFYTEPLKKWAKGWQFSFKFGSKKSALNNLPEDQTRFPAATWLKRYLTEGVQLFILDSLHIRRASPPGQPLRFKTDGSNLPWVVENFKTKHPRRFEQWLAHIRTALPDVENVATVERADDRHRYLKIRYKNGIENPSWMISDGTLRLLALTLPAYLPNFEGVFLIEEPENGIHPKAIETVCQSLSSVYDAQILLASHSPVILSMIKPAQVLCFAKTSGGATDIVTGDHHPALRHWKGETNLSVLFAAGILG